MKNYNYILGCGAYLPKQILTNHELSKKIDTSDEWIRSRTGIKERHIASKKQLNSDGKLTDELVSFLEGLGK